MASGILTVQILDARGLKDTDFFGGSDPYVEIEYRNQKKKTKVAKDEGVNPTWNETFNFKTEYSESNNDDHKLLIKIMDHDTLSSDDFMGETTIYVCDLIAEGAESGFSEMEPCKHNVILADKSYSGEIRVGASFTKKQDVGGSETEQFGGYRLSSNT